MCINTVSLAIYAAAAKLSMCQMPLFDGPVAYAARCHTHTHQINIKCQIIWCGEYDSILYLETGRFQPVKPLLLSRFLSPNGCRCRSCWRLCRYCRNCRFCYYRNFLSVLYALLKRFAWIAFCVTVASMTKKKTLENMVENVKLQAALREMWSFHTHLTHSANRLCVKWRVSCKPH